MQIQCPSCSQMMEVSESQAGQVVDCPGCKGQMQVPVSVSPVSALELAASPAGGEPEPSKQCPFCGESVLKVARKCKHCKEDIPDGLDAEVVAARLNAKEKKLADQLATGGLPALSWSEGAKFRLLTLIVGGLFGLGLFLTIFGFSAQNMEGWGGFGIVLMVIFGISVLVAGINDLMTPSAAQRTTPEKGLVAFLRAIRLARYKYAYACLLAGDKDTTARSRRRIEKVKVDAGQFEFSSLKGFKAYWTGLAKPSGGYTRYMRISSVRQVRVSGDYALVEARLKISGYPSALVLLILLNLLIMAVVIMIMTKREEVVVTKLLRKVGDQWWVVNGELDSPEDRAFETAIKAPAGVGAGA